MGRESTHWRAGTTRFIDLDATGSDPFIKSEKMEIRADGSAIFSGEIASDAVISSPNLAASIAFVQALRFGSYGGGIWALTNARVDYVATDYVALTPNAQLAGSGGKLGFFGGAGSTKGTITGSRGGVAALGSLLTYLANLGLLTDSSTT